MRDFIDIAVSNTQDGMRIILDGKLSYLNIEDAKFLRDALNHEIGEYNANAEDGD